jgi:hypothetical protein
MTIQEIESALNLFLADNRQKVFVLKGEWGSGKSYFIRNFVARQRAQLPPLYAFVSLFGLTSIAEVKETINASLDIRSAEKKGIAAKFWKTSADFHSFFPSLKGFNLAALGNSLFLRYVRDQDSLIVFDDLERATSLRLADVFGLAANLSENTRAKIIIIFNEEKLEGDSVSKLAEYREKVIDVEIKYKPSAADLAQQFFGNADTAIIVGNILELLRKPNIRLIVKISTVFDKIGKLLKPSEIVLSDKEFSQLAKVSCLHFLSSIRLDKDRMLSFRYRKMFEDKTKQFSPAEKELADIMTTLKYEFSDIDKLALEILDQGYCSEETLNAYITKWKSSKSQKEYITDIDKAFAHYNSNFLSSRSQLISAMEEFLDKWCDKCSISELNGHLDFLNRLGWVGADAGWWKKSISRFTGALKRSEFLALRNSISKEEYKKLLDDHYAGKFTKELPYTVMKRVALGSSWELEDFTFLNELSEADIDNVIATESDTDLLTVFKRLLKLGFPDSYKAEPDDFHKKLTRSLTKIAKRDLIDQMRVEHFIGVSLNAEGEANSKDDAV